jgi:hypothetical protein
MALLPAATSGEALPRLQRAIDTITVVVAVVPFLAVTAATLLVLGHLFGRSAELGYIVNLLLGAMPAIGLGSIVLAALAWSRPLLVVVFRKAVVSCGWVFAYPFFALSNVPFRYVAPVLCSFVLVPVVLNDGDYEVNVVGGGVYHALKLSFAWKKSLVFSVVLASGAAAAWICYRLLSVTWPVIKVIADVAMYLGLPEHRETLSKVVDAKARALVDRGCDHLVFVTHSLGSVVAVDYLRGGGEPLPAHVNVTLFTCGSPLKRYFHRFFPAQYPAPAVAYEALRARYPRLEWVNVYRPRDPIGSSLGLPEGHDCTTGQPHSILRSHPNYWADPVCYECASQTLARVRAARRPAPAELEDAPQAPTEGRLVTRYQAPDLQRLRNGFGHVLGVVTILAALWCVYQASVALPGNARRDWHNLQAYGVETQGVLQRFTRDERIRDGTTNDVIVTQAVFRSPDGHEYRALIDGWLHDYERLRERFEKGPLMRPAGEYGGPNPYLAPDKRSVQLNVTLRYLPSDPSVLLVKGYEEEPNPGIGRFIALSVFGMLVIMPVIFAIGSLVWTYVIAPTLPPVVGPSVQYEWVGLVMFLPGILLMLLVPTLIDSRPKMRATVGRFLLLPFRRRGL